MATIKTAIIKNEDYKNDFCEAGLPIRKATWLRAALYYRENLPTVYTIVNNWTGGSLLVSRAKDAINVGCLVPDLVLINQY